MIKKYIAISLCLGLTGCIGAGVNSPLHHINNKKFPKLVGIDLNGNLRKLPNIFNAKYNIVIVAFKRDHQVTVDAWLPILKQFQKTYPNLVYFEIPLINNMNSIKRLWLNNVMRWGIKHPQARLQTITVYTDRQAFISLMDMQINHIYVLLLDKNGTIKLKLKGAPQPINVEKLKQALI